MNKAKFEALDHAIRSEERDGEIIYLLNQEALTPEQYDALRDIAFNIDEEAHSLNLTYEILNDAVNFVSELEPKDLNDDWRDQLSDTFASVYTATRLDYLNVWNQDDITAIVREYQCDIQEACAYWYDEQVSTAIDAIIEWLNK